MKILMNIHAYVPFRPNPLITRIETDELKGKYPKSFDFQTKSTNNKD